MARAMAHTMKPITAGRRDGFSTEASEVTVCSTAMGWNHGEHGGTGSMGVWESRSVAVRSPSLYSRTPLLFHCPTSVPWLISSVLQLGAELALVELRIQPALAEQLGVRSGLHDATLLHHQDAV